MNKTHQILIYCSRYEAFHVLKLIERTIINETRIIHYISWIAFNLCDIHIISQLNGNQLLIETIIIYQLSINVIQI